MANSLPARPRVAVLLSGGVDSLAAILLLKRQGYDLFALHALLSPGASVPTGLEDICVKLHITLHIADLRAEFEQYILSPFVRSLQAGATPNPCVCCNRLIKFGLLRRIGASLGANFLATGHYCRLASHGENASPVLAPAADVAKDQAYFLGLVPGAHLRRLLFPLADLTKQEARDFVAASGFGPPVPGESQDVCFLPDNNLEQFLQNRKAGFFPGQIRLRLPEQKNAPLKSLQIVGRHDGLPFYTPGQRRGMNIAWQEPLYAREKWPSENCLVVAPRNMALMAGCVLKNCNFFIPPHLWPRPIFARLRYRQPKMPCEVKVVGHDIQISLHQAQFTSAAGQLAALYDEAGFMLAAGIIHHVRFA